MGTATKSLLIALLTCAVSYGQFESVGNQHLSTSVSDAEVVTTVLASESVQLVMADGTPVGEPVEKQLAPVVKAKSPAKVLSVEKSPQVVAVSVFRLGGAQDYFKVGESYVFAKPGLYDVLVQAFGTNVSFVETEQLQIVVGNGPNPPPGPTPPGPGPSPDEASPFAERGLRVLFVYESSEPRFTREQEAIVYGAEMREWLRSNTKEWGFYDQDTKFTDPQSKWAKALARERKSLPWLVIGNGETGYEGPLPANVDETKSLIQRFVLAESKPKPVAVVTMYTSQDCRWCDVWKATEFSKVMNTPGVDVVYASPSESPVPITKVPSFSIRYGGKRIDWEGYRTAEQLRHAIYTLKESAQ